MLEMRELKNEVGAIFCTCVIKSMENVLTCRVVSAANFAMSNNNSKCLQISSYDYNNRTTQINAL